MTNQSSLSKRLIELEILSNKVSNHIFSGNYKSAFKGRGMSFDKVREYEFGDDVRHIDWNVSARLNATHVKVFQEERDLELLLLLDFSGSMNFGSTQTKRDLLIELSAILLFSALRNNDRVGVLIFSDKVEKYIPPAKGRKHTFRILAELLKMTPTSQKSDFSKAISAVNAYLPKPAYIFAISDFLFPTINEYELARCAKKHQFVAFRLFDNFECHFPLYGFMHVYHAETKQTFWVNTFKRWNQSVFKSSFLHNYTLSMQIFEQKKIKTIDLETGKDYVPELRKHFTVRR